MTNEMCLYVCVTVVIVAFIIAVAYVLVNGVSYFDLRNYDKQYNLMREELARLQIQCNRIYEAYRKILDS